MAGVLLASGSKRRGSRRGLGEVVEKFSEPDSEGAVSESAGWLASSLLCGCAEEPEQILVLVNTGIQSENPGLLASGSLSGHSSGRPSRRRCSSSRMMTCS